MGVRVTTGLADASVSLTKPRLSVAVVAPSASVAATHPHVVVSAATPSANVLHVVPASAISYIYLTSAAHLDASGLFRYVSEFFVVADASSFDFGKVANEIVATSDTYTLGVDRFVVDSFAVTDVIETMLIFLRSFDDATVTVDTPSMAFTKPTDDTFVLTETFSSLASKAFDDGVSMNDGLGASDGLDFSFSTTVANIAFASDDFSQTIGKTVNDSVSFTDGGLIVQQDYCDLTYFAEDYVGIAFVF